MYVSYGDSFFFACGKRHDLEHDFSHDPDETAAVCLVSFPNLHGPQRDHPILRMVAQMIYKSHSLSLRLT